MAKSGKAISKAEGASEVGLGKRVSNSPNQGEFDEFH